MGLLPEGGCFISLEGVDGATEALRMVAEAGFFRKSALVREGNRSWGKVVAEQ